MTDESEVYRSNIRRPMSLHIRLSKDEYARMSDAAADANLPLADWSRRAIMGALKAQNSDPMFVAVLGEIEFIKLFLINGLPLPMTGKITTDDQIKVLISKCREKKLIDAKQLIECTKQKEQG